MALPTIAPYALPQPHELPTSRVAWRPERHRAALLIHDMQHHFVRAFDRSAAPIPAVVDAIVALRDACHALDIPVFYSAQPGAQRPEQRGLLQDFWGDGIGPDPADAAIIDALAPTPRDVHLTKWRYSAFVRSDLHAELANHGRDQLLICGVYAHIGVQMTAAQAFMEEVQPFVIGDAVADFSRADHDGALRWVASRCGVTPSTRATLAALRGERDADDHAGASDDARAAGQVHTQAAAIRVQLEALLGEPLADVGDDDDLADAGLDSIRLMTLLTTWRERGVNVSFDELVEEPTIAAWAALLERATLAGAR
jgi:bifunctional isochorismate lyase/aryl carrier protein